jgi:hypothetical protein
VAALLAEYSGVRKNRLYTRWLDSQQAPDSD